MIQEAVTRIWRMEYCFDLLQRRFRENPSAFRQDAECQAMVACLIRYYEGGQWQQDYALDEQGLLPAALKRGVLSEDGVYNFLAETEYDPETAEGCNLHSL